MIADQSDLLIAWGNFVGKSFTFTVEVRKGGGTTNFASTQSFFPCHDGGPSVPSKGKDIKEICK